MNLRHFIPMAVLSGGVVAVLCSLDTQAGPRMLLGIGGVSGGGGSCTASSNYLTRVPTESSGTKTILDTLVCGMVTDGTITGTLSGANSCGSLFDRLYFLFLDNATDSRLDVCGSTAAAVVGSPTFTANAGYAGDDSDAPTNYLTTGFVLNTGTNFTQNLAHMSSWLTTNPATSRGLACVFGEDQSTNISVVCPNNSSNNYSAFLNGPTAGTISNVSQGYHVVDRSTSTDILLYNPGNGINSGSAVTQASTSVALASIAPFLLADNSGGTPGHGSASQLAMASIGGHITSAQANTVNVRVCAALHAINPTLVPSC